MDLSLSGQTSIFNGVFFVLKSLLGIERQKKLLKNSFLTRKPRSHVRILIVLYPQDATAINRRRYKITRFFLAVAYEHCITMKNFRFGDKIETSLNLFSLFISKRLSFRDLRLGVMKTQTPGNK